MLPSKSQQQKNKLIMSGTANETRAGTGRPAAQKNSIVKTDLSLKL